MAEGEQKIFTLKINAAETEKEIARLTAELKRATEAQKLLDKEFSKGNKTAEEYGAEAAKNKRVITEVGGELRANTKLLEYHNKQTKENTGSNNQMRAQLSGLTQQYNALSQEQRENADVGGVLKSMIKGLSDELKQNESAVGDNRRNVGNYSGSLLDAADNMGILGSVTSTVRDAQEKYTAVLEFTRKGLLSNAGALKIFKLALAATGIGLVVIALAGLYSFLTKTQEGIDWVSTKTKGLTTVLGVITDKLSDFGQIIFEAFSNPKQALTDLMGFLEKQVTNRLKSFSVIWDAIRKGDLKQLNNGLFQLTTGFENVVDKAQALANELAAANEAGKAIERETIRIREAERALNVERANSRKLVKELNLIAEDTNKSTAERTAAARKALGVEQELLGKQLRLQRERVANLEKEQALTNNLTEDNDKMAEERKKLADIEMESLELQTTLNNKLNTLRKEGMALQAAATLKELEDRKASIEGQLLQVREGTQARLDLQEELVRQELLIQNKGADLSLNQRKLNELKANAQILELRSEFYKKDAEKQMEYRGILGELNKTSENGMTEDSFQAMEARRQKILAKDAEINAAKIAAAENTKQTLAEIDQARLDLAIETTGALSSLVEIVAGQSEEAANFQRALAVFEIGISAAKAIMNGIEEASKTGPFPANLVAIVGTVATTLGYIAQAKALLSEGNAPKAPKFKGERGGLLQGPSHAAGGIRGTGSFSGIEVEGGEALINKKATAAFLPLLNSINMATGGVPLMPTTYGQVGGIILPPSSKELTPDMFRSNYGVQPMQPLIDYDKLAASMAKVNIWSKVDEMTAAQERKIYTKHRASERGSSFKA